MVLLFSHEEAAKIIILHVLTYETQLMANANAGSYYNRLGTQVESCATAQLWSRLAVMAGA
jgi:hypothetical protein